MQVVVVLELRNELVRATEARHHTPVRCRPIWGAGIRRRLDQVDVVNPYGDLHRRIRVALWPVDLEPDEIDRTRIEPARGGGMAPAFLNELTELHFVPLPSVGQGDLSMEGIPTLIGRGVGLAAPSPKRVRVRAFDHDLEPSGLAGHGPEHQPLVGAEVDGDPIHHVARPGVPRVSTGICVGGGRTLCQPEPLLAVAIQVSDTAR